MENNLQVTVSIERETLGTEECKINIRSSLDGGPETTTHGTMNTRIGAVHTKDIPFGDMRLRLTISNNPPGIYTEADVIFPDDLIEETEADIVISIV